MVFCKEEELSAVGDFLFAILVDMSESYTPPTEILPVPIDDLDEELGNTGIKSERYQMAGNPAFPEVIVLRHREQSREKMVRIYRGIDAVTSPLQQASYAMRSINTERTQVKVIDAVRPFVEALTQDPTLENVYAYVEAMSPLVSEKERNDLVNEMKSIESSVLQGWPVRTSLRMLQVQRGGVHPDVGLAPYVSATPDPETAAAYARGRILVMDIPLAEVEDFNLGGGEAKIKVAIKPEYITAIISKNSHEYSRSERDEGSESQLKAALEQVNLVTDSPLYTEDELLEVLALQQAIDQADDIERHARDFEFLKTKEAERIVATFPECGFTFAEAMRQAGEQGTTVFDVVTKTIFDVYAPRLVATDRLKEYGIEDYTYGAFDRETGDYQHFNKDAITEEALVSLRHQTLRQEKRIADRAASN